MDIDAWMNDLIDRLKIEFEERLVLVGLQERSVHDRRKS